LRDIYDSFVTGKEFKTAQSKVSAQRDILEKYQPFPALLKALLARLYEQPRWCVRPPLTEILKAEEDKAVQELTIN
jgi:dihydrodipicolinate synthase/N-acetylneuraminate lyase